MNRTQRDVLTDLVFSFIWSFKKGDNIIYNFDVLFELYKSKRTLKGRYLNKPIILIIAAIIECILDDFAFRVKQHVNDKIPNIRLTQIIDFRSKKLEKFEHYIAKAIEFDLFEQPPSFYSDLRLLQDMRNRLHIQNRNYKLDEDEYNIFTELNLSKSEKVLKIILLKMCSTFPRHDITDKAMRTALDIIEQMISGNDPKSQVNTPPTPHPYQHILESEDCPHCLSGLTRHGEYCSYCGNICAIP
jgi:hypothetical protein